MFLRQNPLISVIARKAKPDEAIQSFLKRFWIASLTLAMTTLFIILSFSPAFAVTTIPFTINMSESVNVTGTPRIAVDVGGVTRYATYASGTGTSALTFNYAMTAGDVDLDGVTLSSPIDLNGGTLKDLNDNNATLTFTVPNTSNVKVNYPSLGMDFTNGASGRYTLNGTAYTTLPSFLTATGGTFTRNSIGTYFDSTGTLQTATANTPRFDYDPITHTAKGLLLEESRTNLLQKSQEIDDVYWTKTNVSISANTSTSPDSTTTMDKIIPSSGNFEHLIYRTFSISSAHSYSVIVKPAGYNFVQLYGGGSSGASRFSAVINLTSGSIDTYDNLSPNQIRIISLGNNAYRICIDNFTGFTSGTAFFGVAPVPSGGLPRNGNLDVVYIGDNTSGIYAWGMQAEQGSFATSYIPTTTAAVTRAADILSIPYGFLSAGTWTSRFMTSNESSQLSIFGTAPAGNQFPKLAKSGQTLKIVRPNVGDIATNSISPAAGNSDIKAAFSYNSTGTSLVGNGGSVTTGGGGGTSPATSITIGVREDGGGEFINGTIKTLKHYPARVPDTQLQLLTQ